MREKLVYLSAKFGVVAARLGEILVPVRTGQLGGAHEDGSYDLIALSVQSSPFES